MTQQVETAAPFTPKDIEVDHAFVRKAIGWLRHTHEEGALMAIVGDLHEYLTNHFAVEERRGGFLDAVLKHAPRHAHVIAELKDEHISLLNEAAAFLAELEDKPSKATDAQLERAAAFARALEIHEQREEGLLQDALERDMQGAD